MVVNRADHVWCVLLVCASRGRLDAAADDFRKRAMLLKFVRAIRLIKLKSKLSRYDTRNHAGS